MEEISPRNLSTGRLNTRIEHLDSCRGVAALLVIASHCIQTFDATKQFESIRIALGHLPVLFFFLLSGVVLGRSVTGSTSGMFPYAMYLVRRFFRLYPVLIVVMFLAFMASASLSPEFEGSLKVSTWFSNIFTWMSQVRTWGQFGQNVFLTQRGLDVPTWTIKVEIVCSALLPLIIWAGDRFLFRILILSALVILASPSLDGWFHSSRNDLPVLECARYLYLFYAGALINKLHGRYPCSSRRRGILLILFVAIGLTAGVSFCWTGDFTNAALLALMIYVLIPCPLHGLKRILRSDMFMFLGRISYSLYLVHLPVLVMIMGWMVLAEWILPGGTFFRAFMLFMAVSAASVTLAAFLFRVIEQPFNIIGHRIAGRYRTKASD